MHLCMLKTAIFFSMITEIREVKTSSDWRKFIQFPNMLFRGNPYYIPALTSDEKDTLFYDRNPAYSYCEAKFWLAMREGQVVGRIGAIINKKAIKRWNSKSIRFGWFDFIEDIEVARALIHEAEKYAISKGLETIHGPLGFTDMDKECWVIEGFENQQNISTIYNPPYYIDFIKELGFVVDCEWRQYKMPASQVIPEKVKRIQSVICERYKVKLIEFKRRKELNPYLKKFFYALNDSFSPLYGFVPLSDDEIDIYVKKYISFLDPELVKFVVDEHDDIIGFAVAMPSLTSAFQKAKGRMLPTGWYHLLKGLRHYDDIDLLLNGVRPEWHNKGIHSLYHTALNETAIKKGLKTAYTNPQIIGNKAVMVWESQYQCEPTFRRAVFSKKISQ